MTRQASFSRRPGTLFRKIEKAAPTAFAAMSSREKRCLPVNPSMVSPMPMIPNATRAPVIWPPTGLGRVAKSDPDPDCCELHEAKKARGELVVAGGDAA